MNHKISIKTLIDLDLVFQQNDLDIIYYLLQNYHFVRSKLQKMMQFAILNGHLCLVESLQKMDIRPAHHAINTAFGCGHRAMTQYLYDMGQRVDLMYTVINFDVYRDFAIDDLLCFLKSVEVNELAFNLKLIAKGNFSLCLRFFPKIMSNHYMKGACLYAALQYDKADLIAEIMNCHKISDRVWYGVIEKAFLNADDDVLRKACRYVHTLDDISSIFHMVYVNFRHSALKILIHKYDPDLNLEVHTRYWHLIIGADLELVKYFCNRLPLFLQNFVLEKFLKSDVSNEVIIYLKHQGLVTQKMLDQMLQLAINIGDIQKIRQYHDLGAEPNVEMTLLRINTAYNLSYDFLTTIMSLGIDVDVDFSDCFTSAYKRNFSEKHVPKLSLKLDRGLTWLAATCYRRHYTSLPEKDTVPTDVWQILLLAKYQYVKSSDI